MNRQLAEETCWVSLKNPADVHEAASIWLRSETARYSANDVDLACRVISTLRNTRAQIGLVPLDDIFLYLGEHFYEFRHAQLDAD